jgi:hypothetical protein
MVRMLPYKKPAQLTNIPPFPYVWLRVTDENKNIPFDSFGAIIDSAADYTCIPQQVTARASGYDHEVDFASDFKGNSIQVHLIRILKAGVELFDEKGTVLFQRKFQNLRLPIVDAQGLLGRDILNDFTCTLDGPSQFCSIK